MKLNRKNLVTVLAATVIGTGLVGGIRNRVVNNSRLNEGLAPLVEEFSRINSSAPGYTGDRFTSEQVSQLRAITAARDEFLRRNHGYLGLSIEGKDDRMWLTNSEGDPNICPAKSYNVLCGEDVDNEPVDRLVAYFRKLKE